MAKSVMLPLSSYTAIFTGIIILAICLICSRLYYANVLVDQQFYLHGHQTVTYTLTCNDVRSISRVSLIGQGAVKKVYLAKYKTSNIVWSELNNEAYRKDFSDHIQMIKALQISARVTQYLGECNRSILFTKFYPFGDPIKFRLLAKNLWKHLLNRTICINLCLSYISLVEYLHESHAGVRVMCDSNDLFKLLSQLLITDNFRVIANDLDALPEVTSAGIHCGHRQIKGHFAAPEQLWPFPDKPFNESEMPTYNEKIDIWKLPDVCLWFLELCNLGDHFSDKLHSVNQECKNVNPRLRPNASYVYNVYKETLIP